jgi:hypothetical protein
LKYALQLSIKYLTLISSPSQEILGERVRDIENLFLNVPLDTSMRYVQEVLTGIERRSLPDIRSYYYDICKTAILIAEHSGLLPAITGKETTLSFVVNMENEFPKYCFELLRQNAAALGNNITVHKEPDGSKRLFEGANSDRRLAEPDLVIAKPG